MYLLIPSYPDPTDGDPIADAAVVIGGYASARDGAGNVTVWVYRTAAKAEADPPGPPLERFAVGYGQTLTWTAHDLGPEADPRDRIKLGTPRDVFPAFAALESAAHALVVADPAITPADALKRAMLAALLSHPKLAGATLVGA
jgi:hypothetical protein